MNDATNNIFPANTPNEVSVSEPEVNLNSQDSSQLQNSETSQKEAVKRDKPSQASDNSHNIDWQQLAHKLREHNRKLLKKVFNLEQTIIDLTNQVQEHKEIARQEELTISEQTEKLSHSQEEEANLRQQLEKQGQEIKSQEVLIQNLSLQLKASQQQTAKLERECAIVQENYNQKNYEIINLTEQKEELESRLYRQQQQTLQYKAALEKYSALEKPIEKLPSIKILSQLKHQPIQPWSDNAEDLAVNNVLPTLDNSETQPEIVEPFSESESLEKPQPTNWQAPEIINPITEKQPKSIAAVKLPKFQKPNN